MNLAAEIGTIAGLSDPQLVGEGGFGLVYRCQETGLGRPVAVKIARRPITDDNARRRFEDECRAAGRLSAHPNVATVHRSGFTDSGQPYLVMEYLPGGSLADRMAAHGALGWQNALRVGIRAGDALQAAHAEGLLHRDLKPENILVSRFGEPMLVDFGLARAGDGATVEGGGLVATLAHAAPELLADDHDSTVASDVYSLASTVFTLIQGTPPFWRPDEPTIYPMLARIATEGLPDLRPVGVPATVCDLLERALSRDPDERPGSALEFSAACREACLDAGVDPDAPLALEAAPQRDPAATVARSLAPPRPEDSEITVTLRDPSRPRPPGRGDSAPTVSRAAEQPSPDRTTTEQRRRRIARGAVGSAVVVVLIIMAIAIWPRDDEQPQAQTPPTSGATSTSAVATTTTTTSPEPPTSDEPSRGTAVDQPPDPSELEAFPRITQSAQSAAPPVIDPVIGEPIPAVLEPASSDEPALVVGSDLTCVNDAGTAPISCTLALGSAGWFATATWSLAANDDDCVFEGDPCPEVTLYASAGEDGQFEAVARTNFAAFLPGYVMDIQTVPFTSGGEQALAIHYVTGGASNSWSYLEVVSWEDGEAPTVAAHATAETNGGVPDAHRDGILLEDFREQEVVDTYRTVDGEWMNVDL